VSPLCNYSTHRHVEQALTQYYCLFFSLNRILPVRAFVTAANAIGVISSMDTFQGRHHD